MNTLEFTYVHPVVVNTYSGGGFKGDTWSDDIDRTVWVDETTKLVRNQSGEEVTSSATVFDSLDAAPLYTVDSKVTLPSGREARVLGVAPFDSGPLGLGSDHIEVSLA